MVCSALARVSAEGCCRGTAVAVDSLEAWALARSLLLLCLCVTCACRAAGWQWFFVTVWPTGRQSLAFPVCLTLFLRLLIASQALLLPGPCSVFLLYVLLQRSTSHARPCLLPPLPSSGAWGAHGSSLWVACSAVTCGCNYI